MRFSRRLGLAISATALAAAAGAGACQNRNGDEGTGGTGSTTSTSASTSTSTSASTGTAGAAGSDGGATMSYQPQGCEFTVAARPEYSNWQLSAPTVLANPSIERVRLGLGGNIVGSKGRADPSTSIGVGWQTAEGTLASEIEWGTTSDPTSWPAENRLPGITWDTPPGVTDSTGPERMHEVYVCGLKPQTTYYYRVGGGSASNEQWSQVFSFTTTPSAGPTPVTIAITGDARGQNNDGWQILQRHLKPLAPTMALFSGDVIDLAIDQGEWESWLDHAEYDSDGKSVLTLPTLLTLEAHGNHDNHSALFFGNMVMPQDNDHDFSELYGELFYSFDVGPVHVIVLDNMYVTDGGDPAYPGVLKSWLNTDLTAANANRTQVPWIITVMHYPLYSSSVHGTDPDVLMGREFFAPIWDQYHVDMAFSGHDHDYERTVPVYGGSDPNNPMEMTNPADGTVYVTCAGSGADGYTSGTSAWTALSQNYLSNAIGLYALLSATPTKLTLDAHLLMADASDPSFDTYTITK